MGDINQIYHLAKIIPKLNKSSFSEYILTSEYCINLEDLYKKEPELTSQVCENLTDTELEYLHEEKDNKLKSDISTAEYICNCTLKSLELKPLSTIRLIIDSLLFSIVMTELKRSEVFRVNVLNNFVDFSEKAINETQSLLNPCLLCSKVIRPIHVKVQMFEPKKNVLDYKWNKKLEVLVNERCELDNAMAWLSTLGGAFSALGDYFVDCAEKAGLISVQQLHIALRIGDPVTICQCKIYLAMSLLQRGYYARTKKLLRELYAFSIGPEGSKDFRLKNMCIAVWNKLKYTLSENRKNKNKLIIKRLKNFKNI